MSFFSTLAKIRQLNPGTVNSFGLKIKQIREQKGIQQRLLANQLCIDPPMLSKIENGNRKAKREHVELLSKIFNISEDELIAVWLGDKVYEIVKDETVALRAIGFAELELKTKKKNK